MQGKTILVVDDEKDVQFMLEKRLTADGYSVIIANNGTDALMLAKSKHPDLIILDLVMPGIEGGEVAARLKAALETRDIPIIFLTVLLSKTEEEKYGPLIGGNITLAKPFNPEELLAQIKKLL